MARNKWILPTATLTLTIAMFWLSTYAIAQPAPDSASQPSTRPTTQSTYDRLLGNDADPADVPLQPTAPRKPGVDQSTGPNALPPGAPQLPVQREGTFIIDRIGRLLKASDGGWEFTFDADGEALRDPPVKVLPNLKLMGMEESIEQLGGDVRFRISGSLTEYRGRNYILLEKVVQVRD